MYRSQLSQFQFQVVTLKKVDIETLKTFQGGEYLWSRMYVV